MGYAMANQMAGALNNANAAPCRLRRTHSGPPPIPTAAAWFAAVNGQQVGPLDESGLQQKVAAGQITRSTLVWKNGMAQWTAAEKVAELGNLFANVPPPLPPVG